MVLLGLVGVAKDEPLPACLVIPPLPMGVRSFFLGPIWRPNAISFPLFFLYRQTQPRPQLKIGPYRERIQQILMADRELPRKQRHTAKRIWERLQEEGYTGGYTAVKEAVRETEQQNRRRIRQQEGQCCWHPLRRDTARNGRR